MKRLCPTLVYNLFITDLSLAFLSFVRSPIHGRGLFCKRNIEAGEMVIEYAGNVIRSVLTDKREKHYDRKVCMKKETVIANCSKFV